MTKPTADEDIVKAFRPVEPAANRCRINLSHDSDRLVLALEGEFDLLSAAELRDVFESLAERHDAVIVDMTDTAFMDSSAIHALMYGRRAGLTITIRGRGTARRTIDLMGLDGVFDLED